MQFTNQENSLVKLAAACAAPHMNKTSALQQKLAEYGIGMTKQAETAGQAFLRHAGNAIGRGFDRLGEMYDNNLTKAKEAQGLTPAQIHGPSDAEWQKGREIYGSWDRGSTTHIPGTPLWEKTPEDYAADERRAKFEQKANNRYKKRQAIWDMQSRARQFKRNQERFSSYLDDARGAWSPEERDRALMKARLLPPRDASDEFTQHVWFPGEI